MFEARGSTAVSPATEFSHEAQLEPSSTEDRTEVEPAVATLLEADLLIEDVSIDGMCGVY